MKKLIMMAMVLAAVQSWGFSMAGPKESKPVEPKRGTTMKLNKKYNVYFGDLHTHTGLSDGSGEPAEGFAAAKSYLDFYAQTDHSQFPDLPEGERFDSHHPGWRQAVPRLKARWHEVQKLVRDNYEPGEFVTFLGYEWTSQHWGDHNVYYLKDDEPIRYARSLEEFYASLDGVEAMAIPHHTAYPIGHRGYDWKGFDSSKEYLAEIFSDHGSSETDIGPRDLYQGNMGPRTTAGTARHALDKGHVFGFIASTDNHSSSTHGRYDGGLAAVYAEELTREALWDAFKKRRTYAVTGDRIGLDFQLNGSPMGSIVQTNGRQPRRIAVKVDGWDCLDKVEIIKNGKVVKRWYDFDFASIKNAKRFKVNVKWGYNTSGKKEWNFSVNVHNGSIIGYQPCFTVPGFNKVSNVGLQQFDVSSKTTSTLQIQKVGMDIEGTLDTAVTIRHDGKDVLSGTIGELLSENKSVYPFGAYAGAFYLSRAVAEPHFHVALNWDDAASQGPRDYYYIRVFQKNGQMAWSSPIWVD